MLVNIQGKGRALDEKSEKLLMEYNMPQTQREKWTEGSFPQLF